MGYRISHINVMLFEAREVPLKFRFSLLTRLLTRLLKYLTRYFSKDFNPVTESLNSLRLAALGSTTHYALNCLSSYLSLNTLSAYFTIVI